MKKKWGPVFAALVFSLSVPVCAADTEQNETETVILSIDTETDAAGLISDAQIEETDAAALISDGQIAESDDSTFVIAVSEEEETDSPAVVSATQDGIVTVDGYIYYYKNGKCQTGWQTVDGKTYYFYKSAKNDVPKGSAAIGVTKISGYWYYFNSKGVMQTGKKTIDGKIYYFYKSAKGSIPKGAAATGLVKISGSYYYFTSTGKAYTNKWKTVTASDGTSSKYYFRSNGKAYTDTVVEIDGATYAFDSKGCVLTGVQVIDHQFYVFYSNGKLNEAKTAKLRSASSYESDASTLMRLLEKYGATLKETNYYGDSCYGNGEDGELIYDTFIVYIFKYASNGKVIVFNVA